MTFGTPTVRRSSVTAPAVRNGPLYSRDAMSRSFSLYGRAKVNRPERLNATIESGSAPHGT